MPPPEGGELPVHLQILPNGTRLLVGEIHSAPVVALSTWFPVGAADDPENLAGLSHFLEHMLFKDEAGAGARLTSLTQRAGGYLNAATGYDHTAFYQVVPSDSWQHVLRAQAEVLSRPSFRDGDVESERAVIEDELSRSEGDPAVLSWRRLIECAFEGSPYAHPVAGTRESLAGIGGPELIAHYLKHYAPDQRICIVVGDVDAGAAVGEAESILSRESRGWTEHSGALKSQAVPGSRVRSPEGAAPAPTWKACERATEAAVKVPYLAVAFEAPPILHEDAAALDVLCGLLGRGRSSRLRRTLQTSMGIVSRVAAGVSSYRDTGVLAIRAVGTRGSDPHHIVEEIFRQIDVLLADGVEGSEMTKSVRRLESGYVLERETAESVAMTLGFFELLGDHRRAEEYVDRLAAVTPDDLLRVADSYLRLEQAAFSAVVPVGTGRVPLMDAARASRVTVRQDRPAAAGIRESCGSWKSSAEFTRPSILLESRRSGVARTNLRAGGTLVVDESHAVPLISVAVAFAGGFVDETDAEVGLTKATLLHALKGTNARPGNCLADEMETLGSGFTISVDRDGFGLGASLVSSHRKDALDILFDAVLSPAFDSSSFETVRSEMLADTAENEDNASALTVLRLLPLLFPGHPYGRPLAGTADTVAAIGESRTAAWHAERFRADRLVVCMSGDVTIRQAERAVETALGGVEEAGTGRPPEGPDHPLVARVPEGRIDGKLPGGGPSSVALGLPGPKVGTREAVAMHVLSSGMTMTGGRLWTALREGPPYAYSVSATPLSLVLGGAWVGHVTAPPGQEQVAVDKLLSEVARVAEDGFDDGELSTARSYLAGLLKIRMQRSATRAASYAMAEVSGLGYERVEVLPGIVLGITNDDVVEVARRYLTAEDGPALVILRGR